MVVYQVFMFMRENSVLWLECKLLWIALIVLKVYCN